MSKFSEWYDKNIEGKKDKRPPPPAPPAEMPTFKTQQEYDLGKLMVDLGIKRRGEADISNRRALGLLPPEETEGRGARSKRKRLYGKGVKARNLAITGGRPGAGGGSPDRQRIIQALMNEAFGGGGGGGEIAPPPTFDPGGLSGQFSADIFQGASADIYDASQQAMDAAISNMVGRGLGRSTLAPGSAIVGARTKAIGAASRESRVAGAQLGLAGAKAKWDADYATWQGKVRQKETKKRDRLNSMRDLLGFA